MNSEAGSVQGTPAGGGDSPVDLDWLRECTDNDVEAMKTLVDLYLTTINTQLPLLEKAIASSAAVDVRKVAHACVGSSGTCGMIKMVPLFKSLETMGASGNLTDAPGIVSQVRNEFERVKKFVADKVIA